MNVESRDSIGFAVNWIFYVRERSFDLRDLVMTFANIRNTRNRANEISNSVWGIKCVVLVQHLNMDAK